MLDYSIETYRGTARRTIAEVDRVEW